MLSISKPTLVTLLIGVAIGWSAAVTPLFQSGIAQDESVATATTESVEDAATERPLDTLDWLIGSWADDAANPNIEFSCQFTKNDAFIVRSFKTGHNVDPMSGMQVLAWDNANAALRSWTFDSDGGFGEDTWTQAGNRYTIRTKYTLPDGGLASSLNVMTYVDQDTFTWKSVNREIDGVFQPDVDEITLVRTETTSNPTQSETPAAATATGDIK